MDDVLHQSALEQSALVRSAALSATELTRAYLARIEAVEPRLSAFAELAPERALTAAQQLDRERSRDPGAARGPLWGLPTAMKDVHLVRGFHCRVGSRAFRWV